MVKKSVIQIQRALAIKAQQWAGPVPRLGWRWGGGRRRRGAFHRRL